MESWKILAILFVSMLIFTPFVILFNPRIQERMRGRNNYDNNTNNANDENNDVNKEDNNEHLERY